MTRLVATGQDSSFDKETIGVATAGRSEFAYRPGHFVPRDAWFPIAHLSSLGFKPLERMLDSVPIVIWRDGTGTIRAMEDRCVHRRAPLSRGRTTPQGLQCPYHGWIYDGEGRVVAIPSMGPGYAIPANCAVPSYPVATRYGHIWIWWGNPAHADVSLMPEVPFIAPDGRATHEGFANYECAHELLIENILDLTHIDFIHGGLLGDPEGGTEDIQVESTDETVTTIRTTGGRKPPAILAPLFGFPKTQDIYNVTRVFVRSGCAIATITYDPPGWGLFLFITNTPVSPGRIRQEASTVAIGPWWWRKLLPLSNGPIQQQDHAILKLQHPRYQDGDGRADRSVPVDQATLRYRAARMKLMKRQAAGDFGYADGWRGSDATEVLRVTPDKIAF